MEVCIVRIDRSICAGYVYELDIDSGCQLELQQICTPCIKL